MPSNRSRGRGRGRGYRDFGGGRGGSEAWREERENGAWSREKGDTEALLAMKKMKTGAGDDDENAEGMREFVELCRIRFGQDAATA